MANTKILRWLLALAGVAVAAQAQAQMAAVPLSGGGVTEKLLYGYVVTNPAAWPVTRVFRDKAGRGCTATAVGERVVITAAHCVGDGEIGTFALDEGDPPVKVKCQHHDRYAQDISADYALCLVMDNKKLKTAFRFETINADPALHAAGKKVMLLGYGCLQPGGADQAFGTLFEGIATVSHTEANQYTVTAGGPKGSSTPGAAVCFGDSGGAAYSPDGVRRRVVAINSRGDIQNYSWLSYTAGPVFRGWATKWGKDNGAPICGVHIPAGGKCHQ